MLTSPPLRPQPLHKHRLNVPPPIELFFVFNNLEVLKYPPSRELWNNKPSQPVPTAIMIEPTAKESLLDMFSLKGKVVVVTGK
jgi:hypothetical protein